MREHEVPTHVQTEDRVLLWFTFPQLVALMVVGASAYGIYRYAPLTAAELRLALAIVFGSAYDSCKLHFLDQASRAIVANAELALDTRYRRASRAGHPGHRPVVQLISFATAVFFKQTGRADVLAVFSKLRVAQNVVQILWLAKLAQVLHHAMDFMIIDKCTVNSFRQGRTWRKEQHVAVAQ